MDGKVALVTGGTSGLGEAIAQRFAQEGAIVVATGSSEASVEAARERLAGIEVVASDASDLDAVAALVDRVSRDHGRIDVLVANAGYSQVLPIDEVDPQFFDGMFGVNVRGPYFLMQQAARVMPDGGAMVVMSSVCHALGSWDQSVYAASKAALRSLGRTFAAALVSRNIRVNTISPGPIFTPAWTKGMAGDEDLIRAAERAIGGKNPMGRIGRAEEIAAAALFLAVDATYTTGIDLPVDGGILDFGYASSIQPT